MRWVQVSDEIKGRISEAELDAFVALVRAEEVVCVRCGRKEAAGSSVPVAVQFVTNPSETRPLFATHSECLASGLRRNRTRRLRARDIFRLLAGRSRIAEGRDVTRTMDGSLAG
jgi:hypothetical protein